MIRVIFLGTNGWFDTEAGNSICTMLDTPDAYVILDAGMGIHKADRYIKKKKPVYIFLSHFHIDHIAGLHVLAKFKFRNSIEIYGPRGSNKHIGSLLRHPFTVPLDDLSMPANLFEIDRNRPSCVNVEFAPLKHSTICYGYRFNVSGTVIAYCTDTGMCPGLNRLAAGADLLICESSFRPGEKLDGWPHMRPEDAADVARTCGAKRLVLTHFDASRYPDRKSRMEAQRCARRIFKSSVAARDGLVIEV
jgi:ribonuclease BN (tRNA processing enzyme)